MEFKEKGRKTHNEREIEMMDNLVSKLDSEQREAIRKHFEMNAGVTTRSVIFENAVKTYFRIKKSGVGKLRLIEDKNDAVIVEFVPDDKAVI